MPGARLCPGTVKVVPGSARNASTASASGASDGIGAGGYRPAGQAERRKRCSAVPVCGASSASTEMRRRSSSLICRISQPTRWRP